MPEPIESAELIAPASRRRAFYRLWSKPTHSGFRVCKQSGAGGQVWHRGSWDFASLEQAEVLFSRRLKEKPTQQPSGLASTKQLLRVVRFVWKGDRAQCIP